MQTHRLPLGRSEEGYFDQYSSMQELSVGKVQGEWGLWERLGVIRDRNVR